MASKLEPRASDIYVSTSPHFLTACGGITCLLKCTVTTIMTTIICSDASLFPCCVCTASRFCHITEEGFYILFQMKPTYTGRSPRAWSRWLIRGLTLLSLASIARGDEQQQVGWKHTSQIPMMIYIPLLPLPGLLPRFLTVTCWRTLYVVW